MSQPIDEELTAFYKHVQEVGRLRTVDHAKRWSNGVLETMGTSLNKGTKKELQKYLPDELGKSVNSVFFLSDTSVHRKFTIGFSKFLLFDDEFNSNHTKSPNFFTKRVSVVLIFFNVFFKKSSRSAG